MIIINNNRALSFPSSESIKSPNYKSNDLESVYTHYNTETGKNEITENKLSKEVTTNGKSV